MKKEHPSARAFREQIEAISYYELLGLVAQLRDDVVEAACEFKDLDTATTKESEAFVKLDALSLACTRFRAVAERLASLSSDFLLQ